MNETMKKILAWGAIAAAVALTVIGYLVLPETLTMQFTAAGQTATTLPKPVGLALPALLTIGFAAAARFGAAEKSAKNLLVSAVGLVVFVLTFVLN